MVALINVCPPKSLVRVPLDTPQGPRRLRFSFFLFSCQTAKAQLTPEPYRQVNSTPLREPIRPRWPQDTLSRCRKPAGAANHSVAAPPSSMAVIYGQPAGKSTRPLHFFDRPVTFLALAPVDNPAPQPAKLLRNRKNSGSLIDPAAVKKFSPAPNASEAIPRHRLSAGLRVRIYHRDAPLQPH